MKDVLYQYVYHQYVFNALKKLAETEESRIAVVESHNNLVFRGYVTHADVAAAYNKALLKNRHEEHGN